MSRMLSLRALAGAIFCLTALAPSSRAQEVVVDADQPLYYQTVDDAGEMDDDDEADDASFINTELNADYNADYNAPAPSTPEAKAAADAKKKAAAAKKKAAALKKAVNGAYAGVFYNNKFDYLCDPAYDDWHLGENLKRMCVGDCAVLDIGGQYRARYHLERGIRDATPTSLGLTGLNDDFLLHRTRLYANLETGDRVRVFVEGIYAEENFNQRAPRTIEVNRGDLLNAFVDVKLLDGLGCNDGSITARVGRQELLYGSQRLVSPLDWANTRRNFDGFDILYRDKDWAIDGFMTRPVIVNGNDFDSSDDSQGFHGMFATYKGVKDQTFDAYYLYFNNENLPAIAGNNGIHFNTVGGRWTGTKCDWLWDVEGGYQFGNNDDASAHNAMFAVAGVGRNIDHCWKPKVWLFYDYSTGGPDQGQRQGFDHLFPLGHKYHGFMDLYARSNIESPNLLVEAQPCEKWKLLFWYHYFMLENGGDTPYNINMTPFNPGNRPASNDLGHEIDLTATYIISPRADLLFGYSHFFSGRYYKETPGVPYRGDADFFYTQFQVNF